MVDERRLVITDLLVRLAELGINPEEPFCAEFVPGRGWTFSQESRELLSSFPAGVAHGAKVHPR